MIFYTILNTKDYKINISEKSLFLYIYYMQVLNNDILCNFIVINCHKGLNEEYSSFRV